MSGSSSSSTGRQDEAHPDPVYEAAYRLLVQPNKFVKSRTLNFEIQGPHRDLRTSTDGAQSYVITRTIEGNRFKPISDQIRMRMEDQLPVVERRSKRQWISLIKHIDTMPKVYGNIISAGTVFWKQTYEWNTNGKYFRFLDLPGEIRNRIYDYCACFNYPYHWFHGWNSVGPRYNGLVPWEFSDNGSHLKTEFRGHGRIVNGASSVFGLLLANKQIHQEFNSRMWLSMEFRFREPYYLQKFLELPHASNISVLCLERTMQDLVYDFGVAVEDSRVRRGKREMAKSLKQLNLSHLTIHIGHRNFRPSMASILHATCQKIVTGLILLHAKDSIEHIPSVNIIGCISPEMRERFTQLLEDEKQGLKSSVTEWKLIGNSEYLKKRGLTWLKRLNQS